MVIKDTYERPEKSSDGIPKDLLKLLDHKHRQLTIRASKIYN